ncbi:glycine/D-amino acid oxidase-like deaminating enzyme [Kibdelosporangium banguiense]|uniref:Glycine/D-amino acid oxidase-like deaminating enzyme n=1 Tax=Kibdelosporangium banguiense TaxID=1365924 RepID=A0ABS4TXT3_9PSEU|nr:FAD-dependent oxidoreductase [Kibdelosporangium banguiense]MBP2329205.1 glycine/D-amino acid oxidase-like deaminating enzyme [Kibdelosporangium banguiense]
MYERRAPSRAVVDAALAGAEHRVFWQEDAGSAGGHDQLAGSHRADLTVVGGGYCGLWTALLAKRRNPSARVILLEAETLGWAASGRNGGFCEASLTHGEHNGRARWPGDYDELERLGMANLDAIESDVKTLGLDCQFERTGTLTVAVEPHQVPWLLDDDGGQWLDTDSVRAQIDSPAFLAGRWSRDDSALVHPVRLVAELARVASELGVEIYEHSAVLGLDSARHGPVKVRTMRGTVHSDRVALATNVFRPLLWQARMMTVPVYDYVLMTEPLDASQREAVRWHNRQGWHDLANQFHYSRMTADNRILYGGYDAVYHAGRRVSAEFEDRPETYRRLASHFLTTFPQLEGITFTHRWAGVIDTSTQFCAFHGLARRGRVAYAAGFTGLGVSASRFAAEVMLDRLAGQRTPRTELAMVRRTPLPFPPEPVASAGIQLTRWALDRADHREGRRNALLRVLDSLGLGFKS